MQPGELASTQHMLTHALCATPTAGFAWSWGPLGWLVPSEVQPLETRSAGFSLTVSTNFVSGLLACSRLQHSEAVACNHRQGS